MKKKDTVKVDAQLNISERENRASDWWRAEASQPVPTQYMGTQTDAQSPLLLIISLTDRTGLVSIKKLYIF